MAELKTPSQFEDFDYMRTLIDDASEAVWTLLNEQLTQFKNRDGEAITKKHAVMHFLKGMEVLYVTGNLTEAELTRIRSLAQAVYKRS
jgi:hypothetical protein